MKTTILILLATISIAHARFIPLGQVTFTGDFTLNHLYDFNNPGAQPFGWFGDQTVTKSGGIFSPYIQSGMVLDGRTLWTVGAVPIFTIGGFTLTSSPAGVGVAGPDSGYNVGVFGDLSGNGFVPPDPSFFIDWYFTAPNVINTRGPITLLFNSGYNNGHVPDNGSTIALMGFSLLSLLFCARRIRA